MSGVAVGVDLGKTSCRALASDGAGAEGAGAPGLADPGGVEMALDAVRRVVAEVTSTMPDALCVGAAGAMAAPDEAARLARLLAEALPGCRVAVTSDSVIAHAGALGGAPGAVLAVGTGAVALGIDASGRHTSVDGWGPWLGDDGGGGWIGREALRAVLRARESRGPATTLTRAAEERYGDLARLPRTLQTGATASATAAFVPDVVAAASAGDEVARDVLERAADAWCDLALTAVRGAGESATLVVIGGLSHVPVLGEMLRTRLPDGVALQDPRGAAVDGALRLATDNGLPHEGSVIRVSGASPAANGDLDLLATEQVRADLADLDTRSPDDLVDLLLAAEAAVPAALAAASAGLAAAVERAAEALTAGGRLVYVGAGTPGRLAALDAAECPPTYGIPPDRVVAIVAGGDRAESLAIEGAEDDAAAGAEDLGVLGVGPKDVVIGITASGRTPYVLAALEAARDAGAVTVAIVNNPGSPAVLVAEVAIELLTGPEVLAGSTRLKAGTAQKVALNVISTGAMITAGRTYGAWMVDVVASNEKLRRRARRILREATGVDDETALAALEDAGWHTKTALVSLLAGVPADVARERLERHGGRVRRTLEPGL
ncbi:MAG TPA: N-acetylmuramic acid 6-phosphate etherase [Nocardioides sp.]|nr:N-acetylmuramic acid 6-phosphate etherase [Nocardioides sp.]